MDSDDVKAIGDKTTIVADMKSDKSHRTTLQNRALHKFCALLSDALNAAGWDMKRTLSKQAEIPWNPDTAKHWLWRPIQKAMFDKESTASLDTNEVSQVYEVLNRHTSAKFGVSVEFPSRFNGMYDDNVV
jgi:hypothetical protein